MIALIVPPFPAVSRPSNSTQTLAPDAFTHSCSATSSPCSRRSSCWYSLFFIFGCGPSAIAEAAAGAVTAWSVPLTADAATASWATLSSGAASVDLVESGVLVLRVLLLVLASCPCASSCPCSVLRCIDPRCRTDPRCLRRVLAEMTKMVLPASLPMRGVPSSRSAARTSAWASLRSIVGSPASRRCARTGSRGCAPISWPGWCWRRSSSPRGWRTPSSPGCPPSPGSTRRSDASSATRSSARRACSCWGPTPRCRR